MKNNKLLKYGICLNNILIILSIFIIFLIGVFSIKNFQTALVEFYNVNSSELSKVLASGQIFIVQIFFVLLSSVVNIIFATFLNVGYFKNNKDFILVAIFLGFLSIILFMFNFLVGYTIIIASIEVLVIMGYKKQFSKKTIKKK